MHVLCAYMCIYTHARTRTHALIPTYTHYLAHVHTDTPSNLSASIVCTRYSYVYYAVPILSSQLHSAFNCANY